MFRRLGADAVLMTFGVMVNKFAVLMINVMLARFSSTELYGMFALLRNTVNLVETTISSSINPVMIRSSAGDFGDDFAFPRTNAFLLVVGLGMAASVGILFGLLAGPISVGLFQNPDPQFAQLGALLLVATNASGLVTTFIVTGRVTAFLPVASITAAAVAVTLAYLLVPGNPVLWALLSLVALHGTEFSLKLGFAVWRKIVSVRSVGRFHRDALAVFTSSLGILILSSAVNAVAFWLLRVILVQTSDNFTPLALFDVSFQYLAVEMMVLNNLVTVLQSRAARRTHAETGELRRTFASGIQLMTLITLGAAAVNLLFADFLIGLYGKSYDPQMLRLLTAVLPFYAVAVFFNRTFVTVGRPGVLLAVSVASSVVALLYAHFMMTNAYQLAIAFIIYFLVSDLVYLASLARKRT